MKMPEPKAYVWAPRKKPELAKLAFQSEPSASLKALGYVSAPLYDKQAMIALLEEAACECIKYGEDSGNLHWMADHLRKLKETL